MSRRSSPILAIDVGGTSFRFAIIENGRIVRRIKSDTDRQGGASWMIRQLRDGAQELLAWAGHRVRACGIGFGGTVNFAEQRIVRSMHVEGWENVDLPGVLCESLGIPCIVDNDATTGALGEFYYGSGRNSRHMVYYTISTGIGGGIILDGKPYRGARSLAGELGHVPVALAAPGELIAPAKPASPEELAAPEEPTAPEESTAPQRCSCGKYGCLEAYCSGPSIERRARGRLAAAGGPATGAAPSPFTVEEIFKSTHRSRELAAFVDETIRILGASVAGVCNILDPDCVVIGGGVSRSPGFVERLRTEVYRRILHDGAPPGILPAGLGDDSVLFGAEILTREIL